MIPHNTWSDIKRLRTRRCIILEDCENLRSNHPWFVMILHLFSKKQNKTFFAVEAQNCPKKLRINLSLMII